MKPEYLRIGYAYLWLIMMGVLAFSFGRGVVEEKTSYGLMPIIVAMAAASPRWPIDKVEIKGDATNVALPTK